MQLKSLKIDHETDRVIHFTIKVKPWLSKEKEYKCYNELFMGQVGLSYFTATGKMLNLTLNGAIKAILQVRKTEKYFAV